MLVNHLSRFGVVYTLLIASAIPFAGTILIQFLLPDWFWSDEPLRIAMEVGSAVVALIAAALLFLRTTVEEDVAYFIWIGAAFVSMGLLDGFHAAFHGDATFTWMRVLATLMGGFLCSLVWLPGSIARTRLAKVIAGSTVAIAVLAAVLVGAFPGSFPAVVNQGVFTPLAKAISLLGGLLFLASAARLLVRYREHRNVDDLLFASQTLLFGGAGVLFVDSRMWDAVWWSWHGVLLAAYFVVVGHCLYVYSSMRGSLHRSEQLQTARQGTIAGLSQRALAATDLQDLFQVATGQVARTLEMEYCKVLELMPDGQALLLRAGVGWKDGYVGKALVDGDAASQAGFTLLSRGPVIAEDLRTETRFSAPPLLAEHNVLSGMSVIIPAKERTFGILGVHSTKPRTFRSYDTEFLQTVANILATAIERNRAEEDLRQKANLLEQSHDAIIVWDLTGGIVYWNHGAEQLYGFSRNEAAGRRTHELLRTEHPMATAMFEVHIERQGTWSGELTQWTRDGRRILVESRHVLVRGEGGHRFVLETNRDITERKQAEESLRRSQKELRALAGRLISAKEEEAKRIARELHDEFGQRLAVVNLELAELKGMLVTESDLVREKLQNMEKGISTVAKDLHHLSRILHPAVLSRLGLDVALESECANQFRQYGITVEFHAENVPQSLSEEAALCLFRVAQEGLQNIRKHAQAKKAVIVLRASNGEVVLSIQDFGKGFDLNAVHGRGGLGLVSMSERARFVGGSMKVHSAPGQGTQIEVRIPSGRS